MITSHIPLIVGTIPPGFFIAIAAVIGGMALAGVVTVSALYFQHQRQKMWHETARIALEKGQPVPPSPDDSSRFSQTAPSTAGRRDLRAGLILIGVGIGLWLWFDEAGGRGASFLGAIPALVGAALLINAIIVMLMRGKNSDKSPRQ